MDPNLIGDRWERLNELFAKAVELPRDELDAFCREACADDPELGEYLLGLLTVTEVDDDQVRGSISHVAEVAASEGELVGAMIGPWHVDELVARGGMGEVYLASRADGEFEKQVVVKVVHSRLNRDDFNRHFRTERQVLASLEHPSIPELIDAGQLDDGRPWLVAQYVRGEPVDQYCERHRLSARARIELIERIGQALAHAHNRLVLHLDIKPDNILVEDDGTPRLLDFGVARLIGEAETGHKAFTPAYASPEQLRGETPTVASDVYSLGVLLFRLLTGRLPFDTPRYAPTDTQLADRAAVSERIRRQARDDGIDRDLGAILAKAMADEPLARYRSMEPLLLDLYRYRHHRPVSARSRTLGYRLARYVRRNAVGVAITSGVFAMLVTVGLREADLRKKAQAASALAEQEAETARQVSTFLTDLFEVSDPGEARGNSVTARELLDKGAVRIREDLADRPLVAAQMMNVMGDVYISLGLYEQSAQLLEDALERLQAAGRDETLEAARIQSALGNVYRRLARFADAEPPLKRALALHERLLPADDVRIADDLKLLGDLYMREGRFDEANEALTRGLAIREAAGQQGDPDYAVHLQSMAMVAGDQGRSAQSERLYLRAIALLEKALGDDHPDLANLLESLGNLYNNLARYEEAAPFLERGLAIREQSLTPNHPLVSYSLMNLSALYANADKLERAEDLIRRAIDIQENAFEDDDYRLGLSRYNLADILLKRGRLDDAHALGLRAYDALSKGLDALHPYIGFASMLLGQTYAGLGDDAQADASFQQAVAVFAARPDDDPVKQQAQRLYQAFLRDRSDET